MLGGHHLNNFETARLLSAPLSYIQYVLAQPVARYGYLYPVMVSDERLIRLHCNFLERSQLAFVFVLIQLGPQVRRIICSYVFWTSVERRWKGPPVERISIVHTICTCTNYCPDTVNSSRLIRSHMFARK